MSICLLLISLVLEVHSLVAFNPPIQGPWIYDLPYCSYSVHHWSYDWSHTEIQQVEVCPDVILKFGVQSN